MSLDLVNFTRLELLNSKHYIEQATVSLGLTAREFY